MRACILTGQALGGGDIHKKMHVYETQHPTSLLEKALPTKYDWAHKKPQHTLVDSSTQGREAVDLRIA